MIIINYKHENMEDYDKTTDCEVYSIHVKVDDISTKAKQMIIMIQDTSWITELDIIERASFDARAQPTIDKLVHEILSKVTTTLSDDFGEFLISVTAQDSLELQYNHTKVPLAELFKEKKSGNPGFDFHTETSTQLLAYGEAKYSGSINPYTKALKQIKGFLDESKDKMELTDLKYFTSEESISSALEDKKAFVAAFSINSENPSDIIENALSSEHIEDLLDYEELYIIGIEVDA
ncbi:hypothetical protein [Halarcobacter mediterraneus]|nr:hypothetical protein [Halarcobacter mediterraneus]